MSLREIATKGLDGFDAKHDAVSQAQGLPAGDYTMSVSDISHRAFDSGWDAFGTTFEVIDGEQVGRKENVNISFAEKAKSGKAIPEFVLDRSIKFVAKLGALLGIEITGEDFAGETETDIHEHLAQKLRSGLGTVVMLKIIETANKNDPANPYRNYDLEEVEQPEMPTVTDEDLPTDPFANNATAPTPTDDELPFD